MDIQTFFLNATPEEQRRFASKARTTVAYLKKNVFSSRATHQRVPRPDLMKRLSEATDGRFDLAAVSAFFISRVVEGDRQGKKTEAKADRDGDQAVPSKGKIKPEANNFNTSRPKDVPRPSDINTRRDQSTRTNGVDYD
jgi:hypothetical protein